MHFSLIILLSLVGLTLTAPTSALSLRACTTITPTFLQNLDSYDPNNSFPNTTPQNSPSGRGSFSILQDSRNATNPQNVVQFVDFMVPPNMHTCTLHFTDAGSTTGLHYEENAKENDITDPVFNVISLVPNALRANPTYNGVLRANPSVVSSNTFGMLKLERGGGPWVINSEACPPYSPNGDWGHLQFVFEFGENGGGVSSRYLWVREVGERAAAGKEGLNGVYLTYNC